MTKSSKIAIIVFIVLILAAFIFYYSSRTAPPPPLTEAEHAALLHAELVSRIRNAPDPTSEEIDRIGRELRQAASATAPSTTSVKTTAQ